MDNPWFIPVVTGLVCGLLVEIVITFYRKHHAWTIIGSVVLILILIPVMLKLSSNSKHESKQVSQPSTSSLTETPVTPIVTITNSTTTQQTQAINKNNTTVAISDQNITYSGSPQNINLTATITSNIGKTINEGTVTFKIEDSHGITVGTSVWGTVIEGSVRQVYSLPGGTGAGLYSISADYSGGDHFMISNVIASLTVNKTATAIVVPIPKDISVSNSSGQVTLSARVSALGCTVNQGIVTFTVRGSDPRGDPVIGAPVNGIVTDGIASAVYALPPGAISYHLLVEYSGADNFQPSSIFLDQVSIHY